jgi:toxin ParE1/3/4
MKYKILTPAAVEIEEAVSYYESLDPGLGTGLLDEFEKSITIILNFPLAWPIIGDYEERRCLLERFPFGIIYKVIDNEIVIGAFMNLSKKPFYWKDRF